MLCGCWWVLVQAGEGMSLVAVLWVAEGWVLWGKWKAEWQDEERRESFSPRLPV